MKDIAAFRSASRAGASLLALTIAGALALPAGAQTTTQPLPSRPSSSGTAPAQTAPVAGPGIANSTVPNNETVLAPQQTTEAVPMTPVAEDTEPNEGDIVVTGVRNAEASAIARKRTARTAQDSIVADDVGQFPDKNAAEAISRIAGVALDVSDSGEQGGFTIRGQAADLIRVEVDGMTTLSTNSQGGRSSSVGEISSDLIKSVDVIKGQTADMTPGGVGGTVRIEQRTGLDFKDPLYRLNLQGAYQSLSQRLTPRINAIATQKFFGGDVGILISGTYEDQIVGTDYARVADAQNGYIPLGDYDNSPEKSFTTPFDPAAAAVTTKAGCATLSATNAINSRLNCYAQWEDFVPSFPRPGRQIRADKRLSIQARADWRVNSDLTVFASYNPNIRRVSSQDYNWSVATPAGQTNTAGQLTSSNIRNVVVNANHYVTAFDIARGTGNQFVSSLNVTTQVRDIQRKISQHYAQTGADFVSGPWTIKARVQFSKATSTREDNAFSFLAPIDVAKYSILPESGLWTIKVPNVDLFSAASYLPSAGANGVSSSSQYEYTPFYDENNEWNYQLDIDRRFDNFGPITRIKAGIQHRVRDNESYRFNGSTLSSGVVLTHARSLDLIQFCDPAVAPAATPCQFGSVARNAAGNVDQLSRIYTLTKEQYQNFINASLIGLPGAQFYSGAPKRGDLIQSWGTYDVERFQNALAQYIDLGYRNFDCLFECTASDGKTYTRPTYSTSEVTSSAYAMLDFESRPFGLLVNGNIGVRYQRIKVDGQPVIDFSRRVATRVTTPFPGYNIENQFIRREIGQVTRTSEDWLPSLNLAIWPIDEKLGLRYSAALQRARPDFLQLTGNGTVTCGLVDPAQRAELEAFLAANPGAVQDDDPNTDDAAEGSSVLNNFVNRCSGRIGNPELKGYGARTQNLSLEWYPNRDTQVSAAVYQISVNSGRPEGVNLGSYQLGGDSYEVATYQDGPSGLRQRGFEIAGRTAFTFLPSFLRYLGGGFNYSFTKSNEQNTFVDVFTGKSLPPRSESKYYYNVNLWYDDTKLSVRVAYQKRDIYYDRTVAAGPNRVPAIPGVTGTVTNSYYKIVSPVYKNGTETLDARAAYNVSKNFQLFAEGKNLLGTPIAKYTPTDFRDIGDGTPYMYDSLYAGRTFYGGAIITF